MEARLVEYPPTVNPSPAAGEGRQSPGTCAGSPRCSH